MDDTNSTLIDFKHRITTNYEDNLSGGVTAHIPSRRTYTRADLLKLRYACKTADLSPEQLEPIPTQRLMKRKRRRRRGTRGGIRNRIRRRGSKLPLPAFTLSNVRSLRNKIDELAALVKLDSDYRNTSLFCFTETWLNEDIEVCLDGFTCIRFDRDKELTGKSVGGGLCMAVNDRWATNFTIREMHCSRHYEILTVSFRPHYLPREFQTITVILVYVPGPDNALAAERILESYNNAVSRASDQPVFLMGDFNTCDVTALLPQLEQYVTTPTRLNRTLDLCFGNIPGAYVSKPCPALGSSDHNVILLLPKYRQKLKTQKVQTQTIMAWTADSIESLKGCFDLTDWDVFFEECNGDLNLLYDTICSYITYCADSVIPTKQIKIFANNKPWITKDLKTCLNLKKIAFIQGDQQRVKELKKELKQKTRLAKLNYKNKMEENFINGDIRHAWKSLNTMMGRNKNTAAVQCPDPVAFAEELNTFYARFNNTDPEEEMVTLLYPPESICIEEKRVISIFSHLHSSKAPGPDGLKGRVLKECANQLGGVMTKIFQLFLDASFVPRAWKETTIIPVPKKPRAKALNDFRPVALTSILCKCMERVIVGELTTTIGESLDPLQFAYKPKRGVEDATLHLLDTVTKHLDSQNSLVRILFMDFSSAFNTVNISTLLHRLQQLQVNPALTLWIKEFLKDRPQHVKVQGATSTNVILNTGVPQGCVLSPILFSIYTNEITCSINGFKLFKYADDLALVAKMTDESTLSKYTQYINEMALWFKESSLQLNISKTKELCCHGRRALVTPHPLSSPLILEGQVVEQVETFKYLGTEIDQRLSFSQHAHGVYKKGQQRMCLLRKLNTFKVSKPILSTAYQSLVESILTCNITSWYGFLTITSKNKLDRITKQASKLIGLPQKELKDLYIQTMERKSNSILSDPSHPLHPSFDLLPSGRRFRVPFARKAIYKKSFIPIAIHTQNTHSSND